MQIIIDVDHYIEWVPVPDDVEPTKEDIASLRVKKGHKGEWLMRIVRDAATHTTINVPEAQITSLIDGAAMKNVRKSRGQVVASYLQEIVMPHHADSEHFTKITVEGEPAVETFLNAYFGLEVV